MASSLKRTGSATSSLPKYAAHARYVCWACCSTWICWLIASAVSVAKFWLARDVLCTAMKGNMKDKEKKKKKERKGDKKWLQGILFACKMGQEQTNIADSSSSCQKGNMQRYKILQFFNRSRLLTFVIIDAITAFSSCLASPVSEAAAAIVPAVTSKSPHSFTHHHHHQHCVPFLYDPPACHVLQCDRLQNLEYSCSAG